MEKAEKIHSRKWLSVSFKFVLTIAAFWFALRSVDVSLLDDIVRHQDHQALVLAFALVAIQLVLGALRWRQILKVLAAGGYVPTGMETLKIYYISVFFNCCLPGTVGGDVIRVWLAKSEHLPLPLSINSVVIDRVITLFALGLLIVATLPWLSGATGWPLLPIVIVLVILCVVGLWLFKNIERLLEPHTHITPLRWLHYFARCLRMVVQNPRMSLASLLYAVVAHLSICAAGYVIAKSLAVDITLMQCITLLPVVFLISTLPISIGGWGVREASMVYMLAFAGVEQAKALMISVQIGLFYIVVSLPAGLLWLLYRRKNKGEGHAR